MSPLPAGSRSSTPNLGGSATRVVLVSGKGGVGKTTVAAATAIGASHHGDTLVASLDRAHNLCAVLGTEGTSEPRQVAYGLWAMEVDPQRELEARWDDVGDYLARFLSWLGLPAAVASEVAILPGLEEILVLSRLVEVVESGRFARVVVDLAPTASTLRYLSFPDLMGGAFGRMAHLERSFLSLTRPILERTSTAPLPPDKFYSALDVLGDRLARLRDLLSDPKRATVRLVAIPEPVVLDETREALSALSLFGIAADAVVMNRVLPPEAADGWMADWTRVQARELARAGEAFADLPLLRLGFQPHEVLGPAALAAAATEIYGDRDPMGFSATAPPYTFERVDGRTVLSLRLADVRPGELDLRRRDRELSITVGRWRRTVWLPESLRRAVVRRARFADGALRVEFEEAS